MRVLYVGDHSADPKEKSIFLAGPSPREAGDLHWRPEAIAILERLKFKGQVFVPLTVRGGWHKDGSVQIEWELAHLKAATVIGFWIPRKVMSMPAFTTNVEFGMYVESGKIVLGFPPGAERMEYLRYVARMNDVPICSKLKETMTVCVAMANSLVT
ncbi:MAG: nucleoside 2-deoxyribosyltransferase domain-containing protein [Candidatus Buchananbacteria bacterium]|nr:nucleoside 2-deoxyribosyltransferase domain-containing protein [Candidatus Buchananbacteria bacterium]